MAPKKRGLSRAASAAFASAVGTDNLANWKCGNVGSVAKLVWSKGLFGRKDVGSAEVYRSLNRLGFAVFMFLAPMTGLAPIRADWGVEVQAPI